MTEIKDQEVSTQTPAPQGVQQGLQPDQQPTGIQIADLQTVLNIIDLASSRGAFRANELTQVGQIADKLGGFLRGLADEKQKQDKQKAEQSKEKPAEAKVEAKAEEKKE